MSGIQDYFIHVARTCKLSKERTQLIWYLNSSLVFRVDVQNLIYIHHRLKINTKKGDKGDRSFIAHIEHHKFVRREFLMNAFFLPELLT